MLSINFIAILVASVVAFIVGFLMHGPFFGKLWMRLANIVPTGNEKMSDMYPQMILNLVANIVCATALSVVYEFAKASNYMNSSAMCVAITCAVLVWVGFNVTATSMDVIWMKGNKKLWIFEIISSLITFVAMGVVIALF